MEKYLRKYFIAMIVLMLLNGVINAFVTAQLQIFLLRNNFEFAETKNLTQIISYSLIYFFNTILALILFLDMKKLSKRSIPILLLTVLQNWLGVIFFLIGYNNEINNKE